MAAAPQKVSMDQAKPCLTVPPEYQDMLEDLRNVSRDGDNPNRMTAEQEEQVWKSLKKFGWVYPVLTNRDGVLADGEHRVDVAIAHNEFFGPVLRLDVDDVDRRLLRQVTGKVKGSHVLARDIEEYVRIYKAGRQGQLTELVGIKETTLRRLMGSAKKHKTDLDAVPVVAGTDIKKGDIIQLGRHRIMCGDCTHPEDVQALFNGAKIVCVITDPPYCSGGFQEAGRHQGSKGSEAYTVKIANDTLSSRGFQALLKRAISLASAGVAYIFTDWRMWVYLFDLVESEGFRVRSMLVWAKDTPGMGQGWRSQHELIMCATRMEDPFEYNKHEGAQGNVLHATRTLNKLHPTQKPVELITTILKVTTTAVTVYDPFGGSGTTLMACEDMGTTCYVMELEPNFCETIAKRWEEYTGKTRIVNPTACQASEAAAALPDTAVATEAPTQ